MLAVFRSAPGFLPEDEGLALWQAATAAASGRRHLAMLEVGTYCGRSTVLVGDAARTAGAALFTVDHHRGSEENQPGWEWHDPALVDPHTGRLETLPTLRRVLWDAGLDPAVVVPVVGDTATVARHWRAPLSFCFLDGNHTEDVAQRDYAGFARHVVAGGLLAIHDVFPDPADGGRPPYHVFRRAVDSGAFQPVAQRRSLRVLRRTTGRFTP